MLTQPLRALQTTRPRLSVAARALIEALCLAEGPLGPSDHVARALGMRNRFALARLLAREGLPSLHRLTTWVTLISWVVKAERDGTALCEIALHAGRYPGACYRQVRYVTGLSWEDVKARGSAWVERRFLRDVTGRERASHARPQLVG